MHTPQLPRPKAHPSRRQQPLYPRLPDGNSKLFWLAAALRTQAQLEALEAARTTTFVGGKNILGDALGVGIRALRGQIKEDARYLVKDGLLPFFHAATTALQQGAA